MVSYFTPITLPAISNIMVCYIGAKNGDVPTLAVATEQGTVHILNTSKRNDWDVGRCNVFLDSCLSFLIILIRTVTDYNTTTPQRYL